MPIFDECAAYGRLLSPLNLAHVSRCITERIKKEVDFPKIVVVPNEEICCHLKFIYDTRLNNLSIEEINELTICGIVKEFRNDVYSQARSKEWLRRFNDPFSDRCEREKTITRYERPKLAGRMVGRDTSRPLTFYSTY